MKKYIKVAIIFIIGLALGCILRLPLLSFLSFESLIYVNNNYANVISLSFSLIVAIVTTVYVVFTSKLVKSNKDMVDTMRQQIKQTINPCLIPKISRTSGSECFNKYGRRQLNIDLDINNIGDGPALSIYVFGWFELMYTKKNGTNLVDMFYLPEFIPSLSVASKESCSLRFENNEIKQLISDLERCADLNYKRIAENPRKASYKGTNLLIKIYFRNITNQWYEVTYTSEIRCLKVNSIVKDGNKEEIITNRSKEIPTGELLPNETFELRFTSDLFSNIDVNLVSSDKLYNILKKYKDRLNISFIENNNINPHF